MRNFEALKMEARTLYEHVKTVWSDYDFEEKSMIIEKRVPKLEFEVEVEHMYEEVVHLKNPKEQFVRECQIKYNEQVYIFEISTKLLGEKVTGYILEVYTPAGDGVGGKCFLFKERL